MTVFTPQPTFNDERAFSRYLQEEHAGRWVAVRDHVVIASAETDEALYEQLSRDTAPYRSFRVRRDDAVALLGFRRA